ncbi:phage repressor protein CI [Erwinia sorbitola]|uniref:Phage repressor protein n=1 Tax=Erwinia sorbitola TaxID=2681984 RepID=A0A6I6EGQ6_9GAMM|nr:phage repressor protein CI [Erwinia sorbitola]MTD27522.1 phage repressor protein [Erwinia sorbitola]QGU89057.1 phage repressor protein [Erwinia sorbitola]
MSLKIDFQSGAKEVLDRVLQAYGFTTKLALAEHLGIASSSLANRYSRGHFPSDIVIRCMADTQASLQWLATGEGEPFSGTPAEKCSASSQNENLLSLPRQRLDAGKLTDLTSITLETAFFETWPARIMQPLLIVDGHQQFIAEKAFGEILDGDWLVSLEGQVSIRTLTRIPPGRVRVASGQQQFECALNELVPLARIVVACKPV